MSDRAPIRQALRQQLLQRLALKGATQGELAAFLGKSSAWISQVLTGKRGCRFDVIDRMAEFFGIPPYLLFIDPAIPDSDLRLPRLVAEGDSVYDPAPRVPASDTASSDAKQELIEHQQRIIQVLVDTQFLLAKDTGTNIREINLNIESFGAQLALLLDAAASPAAVHAPRRSGKSTRATRRRASIAR